MPALSTQSVTIPLWPQSGESLTVDLLREAARLNLRDESEAQAAQLVWLLSIAETSDAAIAELCRIPELQSLLGHQRHPRRLVEEMANVHRYPEAVVTLGVALYESVGESEQTFQEFLRLHVDNAWLFESLARSRASTQTKEQAFLAAAKNHPASERIERDYRQALLSKQAEAAETAEQMQSLYATGEPHVWLALARNSHTPGAILNELSNAKACPLAREIRQAAKSNLASQMVRGV